MLSDVLNELHHEVEADSKRFVQVAKVYCDVAARYMDLPVNGFICLLELSSVVQIIRGAIPALECACENTKHTGIHGMHIINVVAVLETIADGNMDVRIPTDRYVNRQVVITVNQTDGSVAAYQEIRIVVYKTRNATEKEQIYCRIAAAVLSQFLMGNI